jgi:hypothetical protein
MAVSAMIEDGLKRRRKVRPDIFAPTIPYPATILELFRAFPHGLTLSFHQYNVLLSCYGKRVDKNLFIFRE